MRKGAARGPPAPQLGFSFAANPELNSGHVGDAEVKTSTYTVHTFLVLG